MYISVFSPNVGKYTPETLFSHGVNLPKSENRKMKNEKNTSFV